MLGSAGSALLLEDIVRLGKFPVFVDVQGFSWCHLDALSLWSVSVII